MSEVGVGLGAFKDPKPEPRTEDWEEEKSRTSTEYTSISVQAHIPLCVCWYLHVCKRCMCGCLYQCSMCIVGTSRGSMGIAVGCGVCVAVCCSASIVVGIGKHQTLAQMLS